MAFVKVFPNKHMKNCPSCYVNVEYEKNGGKMIIF